MSCYDDLATIHLRMHQVRRLRPLRLPEGVLNTEAMMLVLDKKHRTSDGKRILFKWIDLQEDSEVMERKKNVLSSLNKSSYKKMDELIIPEFQVKVDGDLAGFAMPLIENHTNLGSILHSRNVPFEKKKELLKKLGKLLDKISRVKTDHRFFFGDLNEYNFIVDSNESLKAVDLDSSYISGDSNIEPAYMAYYLLRNKNLSSLPNKYSKHRNGAFVPSSDTDLYAYNMILLNTISKNSMCVESIDTFYDYLRFLKEIGVDSHLLDCFDAIYSWKDNSNPEEYIDSLDSSIIHRCSFHQFQKTRGKN